MKIKLVCLFALIFMAFGTQVQASENKCTEWEEQNGISCIFGGRSAKVFRRQCENACWYNPVTRRGNRKRGHWSAPDIIKQENQNKKTLVAVIKREANSRHRRTI